jgi:16S rRNA pseudouridine516 synthase
VDGAPARLFDAFHLILHKPVGCVTALRDARHPTAYALLAGAPLAGELRPVGRLDLDTSGLLIWTTEGAWLQRLTHPKRALPRTYQAALARPFRPAPAELVLDDGHRPRIEALAALDRAAAHPALTVPPEAAVLATVTVTGGAYHEVRRIFAALGSHVLALCRVGFGRLALPADLAPGAWRAVEPRDV